MKINKIAPSSAPIKQKARISHNEGFEKVEIENAKGGVIS